MSTPRPRSNAGSAAPNDRPAIWINGRQRPSFDLRAYAAYSVVATRASLGPALQRCAVRTSAAQARVLAGSWTINTAKLGRAADYLPTRPGIAATIGGIASLLVETGNVVSPPPPEPESLAAYDALWRARKAPASGRLRGVDLDDVQSDPELRALRNNLPLRPQRAAEQSAPPRPIEVEAPAPVAAPQGMPALHLVAEQVTERPTIVSTERAPSEDTELAIRSLIMETQTAAPVPLVEDTAPKLAARDPFPATAAPATQTTAPSKAPRKPLPAWTKPVFRHIGRATAVALGWMLITVSMPLGLVKAGVAHLEGRDLRDLLEDP